MWELYKSMRKQWKSSSLVTVVELLVHEGEVRSGKRDGSYNDTVYGSIPQYGTEGPFLSGGNFRR